MKTCKIVSVFLFFLLLVSAETQAQTGLYTDTTLSFTKQRVVKKASFPDANRLHFSLDFGIGFGGSGSYFGNYTYVSPYLSYPITQRFRLDVGALYLQGFGGLQGNSSQGFSADNSGLYLYARGNYLISDRLLISGAVYKGFNNTFTAYNEPANHKNSINNYGFSLNLDYKVTEKSTIGIGISMSDDDSGLLFPSGPGFYNHSSPMMFNNNHNPFGYRGW